MADAGDDDADGRSSSTGNQDYAVGYGRPPKHTRFRPGQSGNPQGRPRGKRNFKAELERILNEHVSVREGDRVRSISKREAMIRTTVNRALNNDARARNTLFTWIQQHDLAAPADDGRAEATAVPLSAEDAEIVDAFLARTQGAGPRGPDDDQT